MNCPNCGRECQPGDTVCPSCGVPLVPRAAEPPDPDVTLEPVFETTDPAVLPLATLALDQQGIEYTIRGAGTLDALRLPPDGLDVARSDAKHEIVVRHEDAGRARELLADLAAALGPAGVLPAGAGVTGSAPIASGTSPAASASVANTNPAIVDLDTGATVGSIAPQHVQFLVDALEESSPDEPRYYIDAATIEMLEGAGAPADVIALLRNALGNRDGMEIRISD